MPEPMNPADVPEELHDAAYRAARERHELREVLAAVLPLHEQQVRERIARSLELRSDRHDQDAERYADERSPLLEAQSEALWRAARRIRAGEEVEADG